MMKPNFAQIDMNWKDTLTNAGFSYEKDLFCSCGNKKKQGEQWSKGAYKANIYTKEPRKMWYALKHHAQTKKMGKLTNGDTETDLENALNNLQ